MSLTDQHDPELSTGDLEGAGARWWEVALAFLTCVCVAALPVWPCARARRPALDLGPAHARSTMGGRLSGSGFTLIELLSVIAILGVLAGALLPTVSRAYRAAVARASWAVHCTQARHAEVDAIERPSTAARWVELTADQAFRKFYPQYRSYADVPRETVRYWRGQRAPSPAQDSEKPNP